jgi:hypothetical protein
MIPLGVAGMVQGATGFGLSLTATPFLLLFMTPAEVVPMMVLISFVNCIAITWHARRELDAGLFGLLALGGLLGAPLGAVILDYVDPDSLKLFTGFLVVFSSLAQLAGFKKKLKRPKKWYTPIGFLSGLMGGSTSMGGPPVALFLSNQETKKEVFRANLAAYFVCTGAIASIVYVLMGLLTVEVFVRTASVYPVVFAGVILGGYICNKISQRFFFVSVLILVAITGSLLVVKNLPALWQNI